MLDKDAIKLLQTADAIAQAAATISTATSGIAKTSLAALPSDFNVHSLEKHLPNRHRARGQFSTPYVTSFADYVKTHAEAGASVFINPARICASAVLNLGTPVAPGHADNIADLAPTMTAAYQALSQIANGTGKSQQAVAEFLEDWIDNVQSFDDAGELDVKKAVSAVRKITVESARKVETESKALSASASTFESVQASSKDSLPTTIWFKCVPYAELAERTFAVRIGVVTTGDKPALTLRIVKAEEHAEEMSMELGRLIDTALNDTGNKPQIVVGTYSPKA